MVIINRCIQFHLPDDEQRLVERRSALPPNPVSEVEWTAFLDNCPSEAETQAFLERRPTLLPGVRDLHNGPLHDIVVAKLPLGSDFVTDFAFISRHSMALQFTFVELESPAKPVFNKDGSFSQQFSHARQQVADWLGWAERNMQTLMDMFGPMFETYNVREDRKTIRCYLVYGRRHETEEDRQRRERWQSIQASSDARIWVMSYDRLRPRSVEEQLDLIVCTYQNRGFYVKGAVI